MDLRVPSSAKRVDGQGMMMTVHSSVQRRIVR